MDYVALRKRHTSPKVDRLFDNAFDGLELDDVFQSLPRSEVAWQVVAMSTLMRMTLVDPGPAGVVRVHRGARSSTFRTRVTLDSVPVGGTVGELKERLCGSFCVPATTDEG